MTSYKYKLFYQIADKFKIDSSHSKWALTKMKVNFSKKDFLFKIQFPPKYLKEYNNESSNIISDNDLNFSINKTNFISSILQDILDNTNKKDDNFERIYPHPNSGKSVIIEFSSPNIAKPFHAGHLRSTIIGSFLANLHQTMDINTIKINYLGDWGKQLGLVLEGIKDLDSTDPKNLTLDSLYHAYVEANKNENALSLANERFRRLESGDKSEADQWKLLKDITIKKLTETYRRLGVTFDYYDSESLYNTHSDKWLKTLNLLQEKNIINTNDDSCLSTIYGQPLLRSDGTSLYLSRDIAAAIDRHNRFHFDQMIYVVDQTQKSHLDSMVQILEGLNFSWASKIQHVAFGRIIGMSTRKGTAILLGDILEEARLQTAISREESPTTRNGVHDIEDILGVSAVIVNDLRQRRRRNYTFDWDKAVAVKGDTAVKLHYVHCRLYSLEENCGFILPTTANSEFLIEDEIALELVLHLARFDEILYSSFDELEAYILVNYLFKLTSICNKAIKTLNVKNAKAEIAQQRLLLFHCTRIVLNQGMKILGLTPLKEM